jgi:chemotaxis signal transduction protein
MEDCNAWMVPLRGNHRVAVGELELVHILPDRPELFPVLKAPRHCRQVFLWEGLVVPVFDLSLWLGEEGADDSEDAHLGVFRYRPSGGQSLRYGSLIIEGAPRQVLVNDSQACGLPDGRESWHQVADACFDYGGRPVPILNLPRIFGQPA